MTNGAFVLGLKMAMRLMLRLWITTKGNAEEIMMRQIPYPTVGEILLEEFLKPMGITQYRLAKEIGVPQRRIGEIVAGKRSVTVDTGLRLSTFFGMSDGFWVGLQMDYDKAMAKDLMQETLAKIKPYQNDTTAIHA
jgi:antitoxin HigA-1